MPVFERVKRYYVCVLTNLMQKLTLICIFTSQMRVLLCQKPPAPEPHALSPGDFPSTLRVESKKLLKIKLWVLLCLVSVDVSCTDSRGVHEDV